MERVARGDPQTVAPRGAPRTSGALELVEELVASAHMVEAAAERLEWLRERAAIEGRGPSVNADVGARTVAGLAQITRGDRLEVEEAPAHGRHVRDRAAARFVVEIGQDPLAHEQVELLARLPARNVAQLVAVRRAGVLAHVDRSVSDRRHVRAK